MCMCGLLLLGFAWTCRRGQVSMLQCSSRLSFRAVVCCWRGSRGLQMGAGPCCWQRLLLEWVPGL